MAPASNEEQFKFLISCIRYSNNGKVDFGEVAKECGIVTKGAAAKRYERMMRAHGIASNAATIKPATYAPRTKTERRSSAVVSGLAAKKRKMMDEFDEDSSKSGSHDEETFDLKRRSMNKEKVVNAEPEAERNFKVEDGTEIQRHLNMEQAADLMQYYDTSSAFDDNPALGSDPDYNDSDHSGSSTGYVGPLEGHHGMLGIPSRPPYSIRTAYTHISNAMPVSGGSTMHYIPRLEGQSFQYQPTMQHPPSNQGRAESLVILE
ncbi:uncharacterized protein BP5553_08367 [Venustampulla echinocandica]|uniref:Myb-like DNA-binding domain-containing protein n=1 Tax=Venustampulla echinocandica TaxID=2656787 RepID=A0A370TGH8_9HELO|nr:uncharacterized protein BP5553_08367 [Venustampulla echinocandica]RDL33999.1 hypothetical protein BP5553_08367 [Venustampulla echinocandica]